jgi:hypothetical protein
MQQQRSCWTREFLRWYVPRVYNEDNWSNKVTFLRESEEKSQLQLVKEVVGRE